VEHDQKRLETIDIHFQNFDTIEACHTMPLKRHHNDTALSIAILSIKMCSRPLWYCCSSSITFRMKV